MCNLFGNKIEMWVFSVARHGGTQVECLVSTPSVEAAVPAATNLDFAATRLPLQWYGWGRRDLIALRTAHTTALGRLRSSSSVAASLCRGASAASPASTAHPPRRAGSAVATTITSPSGTYGRGGGVGRPLGVG